MDKVDKKTRSGIMKKVRSTGNKSTEWRFRAKMMQAGLKGWKVRPKMEFSPDFVFEDRRVIVFIDGCFWHACPVCNKAPASNTEYWTKKFQRNIARDEKAAKELSENGWTVLRFWEHEVKSELDNCIDLLKSKLVAQKPD